LVIFDNLVLNLNGFERQHPGGKFNLTHNYGKDISKFFFGGYNLVQVKGKRPHHHSQSALDIVKTLVVGVIEGQDQVRDQEFKISKKTEVSEATATFIFNGVRDQPIHNVKLWYNDPTMIGRHFLVYSKEAPRVKRQYTICCSLNPAVYSELMTLV